MSAAGQAGISRRVYAMAADAPTVSSKNAVVRAHVCRAGSPVHNGIAYILPQQSWFIINIWGCEYMGLREFRPVKSERNLVLGARGG